MLISTSLSDRVLSRCMRSEYSVHTVLLGMPFGTSPALPHWPEWCMHHRRGWDTLIWTIDSGCKMSDSNYRGCGFCHTIPLHLKICVAPLMKSFLHPCTVTSTTYCHNSFPRSRKPHISSVRVLTIDPYHAVDILMRKHFVTRMLYEGSY